MGGLEMGLPPGLPLRSLSQEFLLPQQSAPIFMPLVQYWRIIRHDAGDLTQMEPLEMALPPIDSHR